MEEVRTEWAMRWPRLAGLGDTRAVEMVRSTVRTKVSTGAVRDYKKQLKIPWLSVALLV